MRYAMANGGPIDWIGPPLKNQAFFGNQKKSLIARCTVSLRSHTPG